MMVINLLKKQLKKGAGGIVSSSKNKKNDKKILKVKNTDIF